MQASFCMSHLFFLVHFAANWFLIGLCWLVQRVQYPLMGRVGVEHFTAYEQAHVSRIGPIVGPIMLIEAGSGLLLLVFGGEAFRGPAFVAAFALLVLIWLSTFLLQVPLHGRLSKGFDAAAHASLVRTNWIRTLAWSVRGGLLLWILSGTQGEALG
jgi:hypothetical protein